MSSHSSKSNNSLDKLIVNERKNPTTSHTIKDMSMNHNRARGINNDIKSNTKIGPSQTSEMQNVISHVSSMLEDAQDNIKYDSQSREIIRHNVYVDFKWYFRIMSIIVVLFIFIPGYSDALKIILIKGYFVNLIGLLIIIFHYAFSSSKSRSLISKLLNWDIKWNKYKHSNDLRNRIHKS